MSEIIRAGIASVDIGQTEAAKSLGMTYWQADAPDHPAPGGAGDHSAARQRLQRHAQEHDAGQRHRRARAAAGDADGDVGDLPCVRALSRRGSLLSDADDAVGLRPAMDRAALRRAALREARGNGILPADCSGCAASGCGTADDPVFTATFCNRWSARRCREIVVAATDVHKSFGNLKVLKGVSLTVRRGEVVVHRRRIRIGQDDPDPLPQSSREDRRGPYPGERTSHRLSRAGRPAGRGQASATSRASARRSAWSSSASTCFPHLTALGNIIEAPVQVRGQPKAEAVGDGPCAARARRSRRQGERLSRRSSPAASSSASPSPGRSPCVPPHAVRRADQRPRSGDDRRSA